METEATIGKLTATLRTTKGKGAAHKLRAQGLIPAVCYGMNQESLSLTVSPDELKKSLDPGKRQNSLLTLTIKDGEATQQFDVMLKDYQVDAIKQTITHADFIRVSDETQVEVPVPLVLTGKPEGVKLGGLLHQVFRALPVRTTPKQIPTNITVDVTSMQLNDAFQVKDLTGLPEGVTICLAPNQTIALIIAAKKEVAEVAEGAEEGAAEEGAPAAEGAAPAAPESK